MTGREVALSVLAFLDIPATEFIEIAADTGFDAVSLRVTGSRSANCSELSDLGRVAAAAQRVTEAGLGVIDAEVLRLGPDLDVGEMRRTVDAAAQLGARHLLTVDGGWSEPSPLMDQLSELRTVVDEVGIRPCLEFMKFTGCKDLDSAVAAASSAGVAVLVDTLHLFRSGGDAGQLRTAVSQHGADLFPYLQLCDALAAPPPHDRLRDEAIEDRILPGEGELPLAEVLQSLPATTPVAVEAPTTTLSALSPRERAARTMGAIRRMGEVIPRQR